MRIVFSFAIGNSDMHLKNFSLIETAEGNGVYQLSDAYDMLPVNVIMPQDKEQLALTLNGKKQNIRRKDFLIFADTCGLNRKSAEKMMEKIGATPQETQSMLFRLLLIRTGFSETSTVPEEKEEEQSWPFGMDQSTMRSIS